MSEIVSRIKRLLSDDSVMPMYLMTGDWGSGKTYFIKNTLTEEIKSEGKNIKYLSAYGIESLSDFRDKYLSVFITGEESSASFGGSALDTALSISSEIDSKASGVFSSLVKGFGGVAKKIAINNLPKSVVIIDDIERIKDKDLISKVLGELLSFAEAGKTDIIVVSNTDKLSENVDDIEKVFSEVITFNLGFKESIGIAFEKSNLKIKEFDEILNLSVLLNATNLRVSIKAARRFNEVIQKVLLCSEINHELARIILLKAIFIICHGHYSFSFDKNKIIKLFNVFDGKDLTGNEKVIHSIVKNNIRTPPDDLVSYCCGLGCDILDLNIIDYLPVLNKPEDYLSSWQDFSLNDEEYIKAVDISKEYLFGEGVKDPNKWVRLAEFIYYKGKNGYFEIPEGTVDKYIERLLFVVDNGIFDKISRFSEIYISHSVCDDMRPVCERLITRLNKDRDRYSVEVLKERMKASFSLVKVELTSDYSIKPILNEIGAEFVFDCIKSWGYEDLFSMQPFLRARYNPGNIMDYLSDEVVFLSELRYLIFNYKASLENGRSKGYLNDICDVIIIILRNIN
ncbi:hypothetical protein JOE25_000802 [Serratia sp. PL17]|uniref:hypothetical protein n=1 Tax=Serratia sp. PL17 TaxID=2806582 RepID=UPI001AE75B22|nr:hypothetical protein [Serratia sp. PL17]MBP1129259.1 hypothetical protein [Serratia sp. PL17]